MSSPPEPCRKTCWTCAGRSRPGQLGVELVMLGDGLDGLQEVGRLTLAPRRQRPVSECQRRVGHHQPLVEEELRTEPVALRARPERRVEREQPRLDLGDGETRHRAGELLRERDPLGVALPRGRLQHRDPVGEIQRRAERVREPRLQPLAHHDAVHHDVDVVAQLLVERRRIVEFVERPVDLHPLEPLLPELQHLLAILTLPVPDHGAPGGSRACPPPWPSRGPPCPAPAAPRWAGRWRGSRACRPARREAAGSRRSP